MGYALITVGSLRAMLEHDSVLLTYPAVHVATERYAREGALDFLSSIGFDGSRLLLRSTADPSAAICAAMLYTVLGNVSPETPMFINTKANDDYVPLRSVAKASLTPVSANGQEQDKVGVLVMSGITTDTEIAEVKKKEKTFDDYRRRTVM